MSRSLVALAALVALVAAQLSCRQERSVDPPQPVAEVVESTPGERLEEHVRFLTELDPPRSYRHPDSAKRATSYIAAAFEAAGGEVESQDFEVDGGTFRNVIARFGPETEERVVVGAHHDVCGDLPGADDNASGVAGLLELARRLGAAELETRVELVAYANEEPPFFGGEDMGSARHAERLRDHGVAVRGMICLEMIGCFRDEPESQRFPLEGLREVYPTTGNFIIVVGRPAEQELVALVRDAMSGASDLPVEELIAPALVPGVALSDHRSYWEEGYAAVMITDTAYYRNDNYHTAEDTADTLDYERMAKVVEGVFAATVELAKR